MEINKFSGPNSIPTNFLRLAKDNLSGRLSELINKSFLNGIFPNALKIAKVVTVFKTESRILCSSNQGHIQPIWETCIPVWAPKLWHPKTLFKFCFFSCISTKKYVDIAINDFTMYLIISKWLRKQKCRQERKQQDKKTTK